MKNRYGSVLSLVKAMSNDKKFINNLEQSIDNYSISRELLLLRHLKGLTQAFVAKRMKITQGALSKLESHPNSKWSIGHIESYLKAINASMTIGIKNGKTFIINNIKAK